MIAGRKFILDLLFIKCSVFRWEINMRQGAGWVGEGGRPRGALPGRQALCVGGTQGLLWAEDASVRGAVGVRNSTGSGNIQTP